MLVNIEAERVRNQLTKEKIASELGVSVKTYYNWINEDADIPSKKLLNMSRIFGTTMDYLLEGTNGVRQPMQYIGGSQNLIERGEKN